eukprot:UN29709
MGYIPFHVHHEHYQGSINTPGLFDFFEGVALNRQFLSHADDVCPKGKGGLDCLRHKSYPEGFGHKFPDNKYVYDAVFNDMRPANSEPMEWYSEIAHRTTYSSRKRLMIRSTVNTGSLFKFLLIDVPTKKYSMFWYSFKMQTDGKYMSLWCHNHGFESVYFIASHPDDINMNKYKKPTENDPLVIDDLYQVKDDILGEARKKNKKICEGEVNYEEGPDDLNMIDNYGKFYTKTTRFDCLPWSFKKGQEITVIAFMDRTGPGLTPSAIRQHLVFRGAYELEKETDYFDDLYNYNFGICFEDPNECMLYHQSTTMLIALLLFNGNGNYLPKSIQAKIIAGVHVLFIVICVLFLYLIKRTYSMVMAKYGHIIRKKDFVDFSPVPSSEEEVQLKAII